MTRWLVLLLLLLIPTSGFSAGPALIATAHISTQTTTHLVAAVAGQSVSIYGGSICVDANGATTGVALQSTAGTNVMGTNVVYVLAVGTCYWFPRSDAPYGNVTALGTGLDLVTTVGNGPVEVYLEVVQQ